MPDMEKVGYGHGYSLRKNLLQFHIIAMHCGVHRLLDFVLLYEVEYLNVFDSHLFVSGNSKSFLAKQL